MVAPVAGWAQDPSGSRYGEGFEGREGCGWLAARGCSTGQGPLLSRSPGGPCESSAAGLTPASGGSSSSASAYPSYSSYSSSEMSASGPSPGEDHSPARESSSAASSVALAAGSSRAGSGDGSLSPGRCKNQPAGGATPGQASCSSAGQASRVSAGWPACSSAGRAYCSPAGRAYFSPADQACCSSGMLAGSSASSRAPACASRHAADLVTSSRPGGTDHDGTRPPDPVWSGAPAGGAWPGA